MQKVKSTGGDSNLHHQKIYEVLEPEVRKLRDLMYFQKDTTKVFCDLIKVIPLTHF